MKSELYFSSLKQVGLLSCLRSIPAGRWGPGLLRRLADGCPSIGESLVSEEVAMRICLVCTVLCSVVVVVVAVVVGVLCGFGVLYSVFCVVLVFVGSR